MASSRMIVGEMKSHAIVLSEKPRTRDAIPGGVAYAALSAALSNMVEDLSVTVFTPD